MLRRIVTVANSKHCKSACCMVVNHVLIQACMATLIYSDSTLVASYLAVIQA